MAVPASAGRPPVSTAGPDTAPVELGVGRAQLFSGSRTMSSTTSARVTTPAGDDRDGQAPVGQADRGDDADQCPHRAELAGPDERLAHGRLADLVGRQGLLRTVRVF